MTYGFARSLTKGLASGLSNILTDQNNRQNIFAREVKQTVGHIKSNYSQQPIKYWDMLTSEQHALVDPQKSLSQIVLFSVGGGSFHEYENLKITIEQLELEEER